MYKIGEFSKITGVSEKTLRYYDKIGILKPKKDDFTNYRYYDEDNINDLKIILHLKSIGFTLSEIKDLGTRLSNKIFEEKIENEIKNIKSSIYKIQKIKLLKKITKGGKITLKNVKVRKINDRKNI